MSGDVKLRQARTGDEKAVLDLVAEVLRDYRLEIDPMETDRDISDFEKYYHANKGWFAVLEENGKIVGSCGVFRVDDCVCELRKMYLLKEYQGKGYGKQLLEEAIKAAEGLGYSEMRLESNKKLLAANAMYRKYGFEMCESEHLSGRCDYAMRKRLSKRNA